MDELEESSGSAFWTVNSTPRTRWQKIRSNRSVMAPSGSMSAAPALANEHRVVPLLSNLRVNRIQIGHSGDVRADSYRRGANVCPRGIQFGLTTSGDIDFAPCAASSCAVARPIPVLPPVTRAIFPASVVFILITFCCDVKRERLPRVRQTLDLAGFVINGRK